MMATATGAMAAPSADQARSTTGWPVRLLLAATVMTAGGMTVATFRGDGTAINAYLFMTLDFSHPAAARIERSLVLAVLGSTLAALWWPRWPLALPAAVLALAEAGARWHVQGQAFSEWVFFTQAARYLAPLSLAVVLWLYQRGKHAPSRAVHLARWMLRGGLACVFAAHGAEALHANPVFVDLIISSAQNLGHFRISESTAHAALEVIGLVDLAVAGALLLRASPALLGWVAFWAGLTAMSRVTANGWAAYPDVLVRASYYLAPVALMMLLRSRVETGAAKLQASALASTNHHS